MVTSVKFLLTVGLVALLAEKCFSKRLPSFITPCQRNVPDMSTCFRKAAEDLKPHLSKGIPEMGIPPCDPLIIPSLELQQPQSATVGFDATLKDLKFFGGLGFQLLSATLDDGPENYRVEIVVNFPHVKMESDYKAKGKVLIAQFEGEGQVHGEYDNVTLYGSWTSTEEKKGEKTHFKLIKDDSKVTVGKVQIEFEDLFKNNKELTDQTNKLINENTEILFNEVKPIIEKTISEVVTGVVKYVLRKYTTEELFPTS